MDSVQSVLLLIFFDFDVFWHAKDGIGTLIRKHKSWDGRF